MKKFIINAIAFLAILILPAPIWLVLTHKESYPVDPDRNLLFIGDSRIKYGIDDRILTRATNHSYSGETPYGAYVTLRAMLSGENNIDTVVLGFWGSTLGSNIEKLSDEGRGFDKRMQYVTLDDIYDTKMTPATLIEPLITTILYSTDNPHGGFKERYRNNLKETILNNEISIENNDGNITTHNIYKTGVRYRGFCKIQELCKEKGVTLILMTVPAYNSDRYFGQADFKLKLRDSLRGCGLTYVDFSDFPLADSCYADALHLNPYGSNIFSEHLRKNGLLSGADEIIELK